MSPIIITIICAFLGSAGLFAFIQFLIQRHDNRTDVLEEIRKENTQMREEHKRDIEMLRDERIEADEVLRKERDELNQEIHELLNMIKEQTLKNERDNVRVQLLLLMADYPDDVSELMHCAEHYFKELDGNWYATPLFVKYLKERGIAAPEWLLS